MGPDSVRKLDNILSIFQYSYFICTYYDIKIYCLL